MGLVIKADLARRRAALSCNASQMSPFLVMRSFLQILLTVGCFSSRDAGWLIATLSHQVATSSSLFGPLGKVACQK